jgi:hypothetical protein
VLLNFSGGLKSFVAWGLNCLGYKLVKTSTDFFPVEANERDRCIRDSVFNYTMTSDQRLWALLSATKYIVTKGIKGDFVECGVWRGGSAMVIAYQLLNLNVCDRHIWLYDTFAGMTEPTEEDIEANSGISAALLLAKTQKKQGNNVWCLATKEDVSTNVYSTGYPVDMFKFVQGDILETLEGFVPDSIALLRLDTDWYESTKRELEVLFPKLVSGGICIIDDYGHWSGARKAVDEYFKVNNITVLMHYIDQTGRMFVKE